MSIDYFSLFAEFAKYDTLILAKSKNKLIIFKHNLNDFLTLNTIRLYLLINNITECTLLHRVIYKNSEQASDNETGILVVNGEKGSLWTYPRKLQFKFRPSEYFNENYLQLTHFTNKPPIDSATKNTVLEALKNVLVIKPLDK